MKTTRLSAGKTVILVTLILNFAFVFLHAAFPPSVSGAEIDAVGGALNGMFSENSPFGAFLQRNISNIAHFCEYGALGVQVGIAVFLWFLKKFRTAVLSVLLVLGVGFLDETVQIFSGRHSSVADIWIDLFGYVTCIGLTFGIMYAARGIRNKLEQRKDRNGKNN